MHNKIFYSSESDCEERLSLHVGQSDKAESRDNGIGAKIPSYVADINKKSKLKSANYKYILQKARALEQWVQKCIDMLRNEKGKAINIHSSGIDITHRKNAERALLESSEKIKRFTYFVSHDLKNPAISLIGLTRCLKRKICKSV